MNRYKSALGQQLIQESYDKLLSAWDVVIEQKTVPTSFGDTHIITAGAPTRPPLLLLHGTADNSAMMWIYNMRQLSEQFYVIAVDAIGGSGKSEPNEHYYKAFDQAVWLDELLSALEIEEVSIAGVSYGAYLAYHYAIMRPGSVDKIVCMAGTVAESQFEVMWKMMRAFLPEALFPTEASCRKLLRKLTGPHSSVFEDNAELMRHWYYLLKYFNNRSMMKHKLTMFGNEQIESLHDKALFLIGEHDPLSNYPKAIDRLKHHQLRYKIIAEAGHAINHERADLINAEIVRHLSQGEQ